MPKMHLKSNRTISMMDWWSTKIAFIESLYICGRGIMCQKKKKLLVTHPFRNDQRDERVSNILDLWPYLELHFFNKDSNYIKMFDKTCDWARLVYLC